MIIESVKVLTHYDALCREFVSLFSKVLIILFEFSRKFSSEYPNFQFQLLVLNSPKCFIFMVEFSRGDGIFFPN